MNDAVDAGPETTLVIEGMGARVGVEVSGRGAAEFTERLRALWSRCLPDHERSFTEVPTTIQVALTEDQDVGALLEHTTQRVTLALLHQQAGKLLLFHAGGVSDPRTGRSVAYVAASRTGKTTLTLELGRCFGYLSDETIALTEDLAILPYPKPLSVRDRQAGPRQEISPDALGLLQPPPRPQLAALLLLDRSDDHEGPPEVTPLDLFDAISLLTPQTSSLSKLDAGLHRLQALTERAGDVLKVSYREAASLVPVVTDLLESGHPDVPTANDEPMVRAVPPTDALTRDDEALLLYGDRLVRLGALGATIIGAASRPITTTQLTHRLIERLGPPDDGDAHAATLVAVEQLIADGVLGRIEP